MKLVKNKYTLLAIIFIIGFLLRFYNLSVNPPSLNWDEVSTGYNAYSILKTGKDEYGTFLPLSIRSFDDYKPPLYVYLTVPSIGMFGVNEFAVRFPSALLGSLTILVVFFLVRKILEVGKTESSSYIHKNGSKIGLVAAFLFAISPWSLQFSRAAYEGNIGLFFLLSGVFFLFKFLEKPKFLVFSSVFLVLSMYSYHSFRLVIPLFLLCFAAAYFKNFWRYKVVTLVSIIIFGVLTLPIFSSFLFSTGGSGSRLSMVTIFGDTPQLQKSIERLEYDKSIGNPLGYIFENRRFVYALAAVKGYLEHYNPGYLFIYGDGGVQHHAVDFGMLYLFSLPFIVLGVFVLAKNMNKKILILFVLMILAPLASSISSGAPHPVRAIIMAPIFDIFAALGVFSFVFMMVHINKKILGVKVAYIILTAAGFFVVINITYYFHQYYVHTPREYGYYWQYGNKEAVLYAKEKENKYDKIIMTYEYDQPYAFYLFYNKIDPAWYQQNWDFTKSGEMPRFERIIGKYEFRDVNWGEDQKNKNTLIIGTPDEVPEGPNQKIIYFPDGSIAYRIAETQK